MATDSISHYSAQTQLTLEPNNPQFLANLCGQFDEHIRLLEQRLGVRISARGNVFHLDGSEAAVHAGKQVISSLYSECKSGASLGKEDIHLHLKEIDLDDLADQHGDQSQTNPSSLKNQSNTVLTGSDNVEPITVINTKKLTIKPRGKNQQAYVRAIKNHDVTFGIGPAGTGKTYLAVACAVEALLENQVQRILLVRPAVEAGEKLGFLPGDLAQKIDPYLRPLYDALYEMLGAETVNKLIEKNIIEIAPLAYMRGRTLNESFIIMDESQNTTREQMKMFLTRIGFGSTAVINGDATQIDLPRGTASGLTHVLKVLENVEAISKVFFSATDIVRHPLVQKIVEAYEAFNTETPLNRPEHYRGKGQD